jgi:hypothetical protein
MIAVRMTLDLSNPSARIFAFIAESTASLREAERDGGGATAGWAAAQAADTKVARAKIEGRRLVGMQSGWECE